MRILHAEDESWDSGIAHYALTLAREQKARGHEVFFWGRKGSDPCRKAREFGLSVHEIKSPWTSLRQLRRELRRRGIQLINAHTGSSHSLAAAAAAGLPIPLLRTRGDVRPPSSHALSKALARRTAAFIAANSQIKESLSETYPDARVELIFQGIEAPPPPPLPEDPVVGILARLDPVKGHEDFLVAAKEAIRSFPAARFLVAGTGPGARAASLQSLAEKFGLTRHVEFLGRVEDAMAFIARCRIGVVASVASEAVSRAALEWMSQGRPVVATRAGCLPDLVDSSCGASVPCGHPGQIALALKQLLKDPKEAARLGAAARGRFERRFALQRFADETERLYEDTLRAVPS